MTAEKKELQKSQNETSRTRKTYSPRADVYEQNDRFVIVADLPGIGAEGLDIDLEKNILTIRGKADSEQTEGYRLAYREYEEGDYERRFILSSEVDREKIEATFTHGVLKLAIPKAEASLARKITVRAA